MSPEELEAFLQGVDGPDEPGFSVTQRTEQLQEVLLTARQLWSSGSVDVVPLLQRLASACRKTSWRGPMGVSGILDLFLGLLSESDWPLDREPMETQILRLAGNACADTDENRARVVEGKHIPILIRLLDTRKDDLLHFIISCLYNISLDYEPAQLAMSEAGLGQTYAAFLDRHLPSTLANDYIGTVGKTMSLLAAHERERQSASVAVPTSLLRFATKYRWDLDMADFCSLVSAAVEYLSNDRRLLEALAATGHGAAGVFDALDIACTRYRCEDAADEDDAAELKAIRKSLVGLIADLTATPEWERLLQAENGEELILRKMRGPWLGKHHSHLQEAACLALGNLACSDAASTLLVQQDVHRTLFTLLSDRFPYLPEPDDSVPSAVLHGAIGLLRNLAIPAATKSIIGPLILGVSVPDADGDQEQPQTPSAVIARIWGSSDIQPPTQLAAMALTRLLLVGTPSNAALLCAPLPQSPRSEEEAGTASGHAGPLRTTLHDLIKVFAKVEPEPTKIEAARTAMTLCRVLHSPTVSDLDMILPNSSWGPADSDGDSSSPEEPATDRRVRFYSAHEGLPTLLSFLVTQKRFPALRSEAWFVFALMSRSPDGAAVVAQALTSTPPGSDREGAFEMLALAVGADSEQKDGTQSTVAEQQQNENAASVGELEAPEASRQGANSKDRENGLVLLTELLRNLPASLPEAHRLKFEQLLRDGGQIVLVDRAKEHEGGLASASTS